MEEETTPRTQASTETTVSEVTTTGPRKGFDRISTDAGHEWTLLYLITGSYLSLLWLSPSTSIEVAKTILTGALASYWTMLKIKEKL